MEKVANIIFELLLSYPKNLFMLDWTLSLYAYQFKFVIDIHKKVYAEKDKLYNTIIKKENGLQKDLALRNNPNSHEF